MTRIAGLIAALVLGAALWPTPSRSEPEDSLGLPAELAAYREWTQILQLPRVVPMKLWVACMPPTAAELAAARRKYGPHTERFIRVFGNKEAVAAFAAGDPQRLPPGALIVKEKLSKSPQGSPEGVAFMIKRPAPQLPDTNGWEFLYFPATGEAAATHESCASCHRAAEATDYVFGTYPE